MWPPSELSEEELNTIAERVLPPTAGIGLEEIAIEGAEHSRAAIIFSWIPPMAPTLPFASMVRCRR